MRFDWPSSLHEVKEPETRLATMAASDEDDEELDHWAAIAVAGRTV